MRRRQLNVRLLACILAPALLLGAGVHVLHGYQVMRNAAVLLKQADRFEEEGKLDSAAYSLQRYLDFEPNDTEALARYGLLLDRLATTQTTRDQSLSTRTRALTVLEQVLRRAPDRHDLRRAAIDAANDLGQVAKAETHLDALLASRPEDGELHELLGRCRLAGKRFASAAEAFEAAIEHTPGRVASYRWLAHLLRDSLEDPDRADAVMEAMVAANDQSPQAYLWRGLYRQQYGLADAGADIARARELAPDDADVLFAAARLNLEQGELDEARADLRRGLEQRPQDRRLYEHLAKLELRDGRPEEAVSWLCRGLEVLTNPFEQREFTWLLADLLIDQGQFDEAAPLTARLRSLEGALPETVDYLDARIAVGRDRWAEAASLLERALPRLATSNATGPSAEMAGILAERSYLLLGRCHTELGQADRRLAAYRRAVARNPQSIEARLGMAAALAALGRTDDALAEYRRVTPQQPAARLEEVRLLITRNGRLAPAQRQWRAVDRALDEAARALPEAVDIPLLRAAALVGQGQLDQARDMLQQARDRHPHQAELWVALATLAEQQAPDRAAALLDEAQGQLGDRVEIQFARLRMLLRQGSDSAAQDLEQWERALESFEGEDQFLLRSGLAEAYALIGEPHKAQQVWNQLAQERPDHLGLRLQLFDLALRLGDDGAMARLIAEIRGLEDVPSTKETEGTLWRYGEARLLIWRAGQGTETDLPRARRLLEEVARQRPSWSLATLAQAQIADLEGKPDEAIAAYLRAIEQGEQRPAFVYRVVALLVERRRHAEADRVLRTLQERATLTGPLAQLATGLALEQQDLVRARDLARAAVPAGSEDYRDHLWIGQVSGLLGQTAEAEQALRRAVSLAEDVPETWLALIGHLARTDQVAQAEAAIEEARGKLPDDRKAATLARGYEILGQRHRAEEHYQAALEAQPDDVATVYALAQFYMSGGQFPQAEPLLRRLLEPDRAEPGDMIWARRLLAIGLVSSGQPPQVAEALRLIDQNLAEAPQSIADQRARAVALAAHTGRLPEAIRILEDLNRRQDPTPDEQFLLARFYEVNGDWTKARDLMQELVTAHDRNSLYLASYIGSLLKHNRTDEAQGWLNRLEQLEPQALRTIELKARVLEARGRGDKAAALLVSYVDGQDAPAIGVVAVLLEQLSRFDEAETLYRAFADRSEQPDRWLVLAEFLGRRDRTDEALDLCARAWGTCPPARVIHSCLTVLMASSSATGEHFQRVEHRLETAAQDMPPSPLSAFRAALRGLQQRYPEAERLYREALAQNPRNIMALNNLSWLLALRGGRDDEALKLIDQAIELAGPAPALLDTRAIVHLKQDQADLAIRDLQSAIAGAPTAPMYVHLAQAQWRANNRNAAIAALQEANALGLAVRDLDHLERPAYHELLAALGMEEAPVPSP